MTRMVVLGGGQGAGEGSPLDLQFKGLKLQLWKLLDENFDEMMMKTMMRQ